MNEKKNYVKELASFWDGIDENLAKLTEEEIDQDLIQLEINPDKAVQDVSDLLINALDSFKMNKLNIAKKKRLNLHTNKNEFLNKILTFTREALIDEISKYDNTDAGYAFRELNLDIDKINTEDLRAMLVDLTLTKQFKDNE